MVTGVVLSSERLQQWMVATGDRMACGLEGVEGKLKNLKLSDAEKKGVKIGRRQACASTVGKLQAIGKLLSERPAKAEYVGRTLGGIWSPFTGVECKDLGRNRFLFSFHDEASKRKALDNGPWTFNKELLVMEGFMPSKTIDEYEFKTVPIWVRAYGIPMGMMNLDTGNLVGGQVGEFLDEDLDDDGSAMGEFMRIKIRMDITIPLMRFITLEIEDDEEEHNQMYEEMMGADENVKERNKHIEEKIITLKYEHLPDFCYNCGIIGHTEKSCPTTSRRGGERQFGPWLRAIILKGSPGEEKSRSSSERGNFWLTYSDGGRGSKQGSDGPSWRKSVQVNGDEGRPWNCEQEEVKCPLKTIQGDQRRLVEGKKLMSEYSTQEARTESNKAEVGNDSANKAVVEHALVPKDKEHVKQIPVLGRKEEEEDKEKPQLKESLHSEKESEESNNCKTVKQGTFKRIERAKKQPRTEKDAYPQI